MEKEEASARGKPKEETITGVVVEALPDTIFRVETAPDNTILAYLSGKMRLYRIRVLVGDRVEIVPDLFGGKGRIIRRL